MYACLNLHSAVVIVCTCSIPQMIVVGYIFQFSRLAHRS